MNTGELLKEAREKLNIPLSKASDDLFIRITYLEAIENNRPEILPSAVQGRGFLRMYAEYLHLDPQEILRLWDGTEGLRQQQPDQVFPSPAPVGTVEPPEPRKFFPLKKSAEQPEAAPPEDSPIPPLEADPVQDIYNAIGSELKARREALVLTLDDAERFTLVRSYYLDLIEQGNFEELPSTVQARGMLNNYAAFLNLDVDDVMLRYANALQLRTASKAMEDPTNYGLTKPSRQKPVKKAGKLNRFITPDLFVGVTVLLVMAAIIIYSAVTITEYKQKANQSTAEMAQYMTRLPLIASAQATVEATTAAASATPLPQTLPLAVAELPDVEQQGAEETAETATPEPVGPIYLYIEASQRTFLQVVTDGTVAFNGRTLPGNTYPFDGKDKVKVTIGNAAAVSIIYNNQNLGSLGSMGQVVSLEFTGAGIQTPTPLFSPTPTPDITATPTEMFQRPTLTVTITPYIP